MEDNVKNLTTVEQFAMRCENASSDLIYDLFEYRINNDLRELILACDTYNSSEPVRDALNSIGLRYNVASLINY